jgi:hypothetical protein
MSWFSKSNKWMEMVGHCDCIQPCSGYPVLKLKPGEVCVAADVLPEYLQCSECGCAPLPEIQPKLLRRYRKYMERKAGECMKSRRAPRSCI